MTKDRLAALVAVCIPESVKLAQTRRPCEIRELRPVASGSERRKLAARQLLAGHSSVHYRLVPVSLPDSTVRNFCLLGRLRPSRCLQTFRGMPPTHSVSLGPGSRFRPGTYGLLSTGYE